MGNTEGKVLIASSALKESGFDGLATIKVAAESSYSGCQLYLDARYRDESYRAKVIESILKVRGIRPDFILVVHLPNAEKFSGEDAVAVSEIGQRVSGARFLIHFDRDAEITKVENFEIELENASTGTFDTTEVKEVWERVLATDRAIVLDFGRFWYGEEQDLERIIEFTKWQINRLNPDKGDMLHLTDKTKMMTFRTYACVLGQGLVKLVMPEVLDFMKRGGVVVLEYEDLEMENASRDYLLDKYHSIGGKI